MHRALQFNATLLFARLAQGRVQLACFAQRRCPTIRWSRRLKQLRFHFASVLARLNSTVMRKTEVAFIAAAAGISLSKLCGAVEPTAIPECESGLLPL